jgi:serine/threonine protein kinase
MAAQGAQVLRNRCPGTPESVPGAPESVPKCSGIGAQVFPESVPKCGRNSQVQIADLGVARLSFVDDPAPGGTPLYMAPERFAGARASAAADQFSLCVALWEALYGVRPWSSNTADVVGATAPARARLRVDVPEQLLRVLQRGLAVNARQRHEDMGALADALTRVLFDARRREDRRWLLAAVVTAVAIILALVWLITRWI